MQVTGKFHKIAKPLQEHLRPVFYKSLFKKWHKLDITY